MAHPSLERDSALWHQVSPQPDADTQAAPPASSGFPDVSGSTDSAPFLLFLHKQCSLIWPALSPGLPGWAALGRLSVLICTMG